MVMAFKLLQSTKASLPIDFKEEDKLMEVRLKQSAKALFPIEVTEEGKSRETILEL